MTLNKVPKQVRRLCDDFINDIFKFYLYIILGLQSLAWPFTLDLKFEMQN